MESDLNFAQTSPPTKMSYNSSPGRRKEKDFSGKGNAKIKVCVRIRPMLQHEESQGHTMQKISIRDEKHIEVTN